VLLAGLAAESSSSVIENPKIFFRLFFKIKCILNKRGKKMFSFVTAPFLLILVCLIGFKIDDYFQWKDVEKTLREQGESKEDIAKVKRLYMD
jgi:hypothetical protein